MSKTVPSEATPGWISALQDRLRPEELATTESLINCVLATAPSVEPDTGVVERVARTICEAQGRDPDETVEYLNDGTSLGGGRLWRWEAERQTARAAIAAMPGGGEVGAAGKAQADVLAERRRQIEAEGWTPEHDDAHTNGELATAAGCYALWSLIYPHKGAPPAAWPWGAEWWKPKDRRRNLVRAAALIIAEIERLDRSALQGGGHDD